MILELVDFLKRESDILFWKKVAVLATLSGISNASLLSTVNTATEFIENDGENYRYFALYIVVFIIFFLAKKNALMKVTSEIETIIYNVRNRISNKNPAPKGQVLITPRRGYFACSS